MASNGTSKYSPFEIPFNPEPLRTPRKLRMVCIGSGFAGLTLAYKIQHERKLGDVIDFQIYERLHDVGGTWLVNKYPGLTCDVPIHIYTLPWAPKHDWSRYMVGGNEILQYVRDVTRKFGLDRWIKFHTSLQEATWDEASGKWKLKLEGADGPFEDECDILIGAAGTQNTPVKSAVPGLDKFRGPVVHTGHWDESLDCKGKRIAVIGNGSSGIQAFGALQKQAKQITHYIRSATWISLNYMSQFTRNADGRNFEYTDEEKAAFQDPGNLLEYRRKLESVSNGIFKNLVFDETAPHVKKGFRAGMEKVMKERLNDNPELVGKLMPTYQPWCRRLTPGDGYLEALQESNATLVDDPVVEVTPTGIRTNSGENTEYDIIVAATGFVNSRVVPWKMVGRDGVGLAERFRDDADGYMSVAAPSMPNYFSIGCGPNFTIANGPVLSALGFLSDYVLQWAEKMAEEDIRSICVKDDVVEAYNIYIQQVLRRTAWSRECESWYKKGRADEYRTGITAIYPGSMMHFKSMLEKIRPEDFDIKYRSANPFNFYGCGLTALDMSPDNPDLSYYLSDTMKLDSIM
ncbi:hypothetical protein LTR85_010353 [Meristemomyces frigidus]|nr:hypothetical protein LTR85_010353 [Meristemomyces frigidus]